MTRRTLLAISRPLMGAGLALALYTAPAMAWGGGGDDGGHAGDTHGAKVSVAAHSNSTGNSDKDAHGDAVSAAAHARNSSASEGANGDDKAADNDQRVAGVTIVR
ncbi:MAG: hypothetical protein JO247_11415, partial [Chloroflexi bacterium]|nr:hypothetical protein [Chloroflexota bacterium]